MSTVDDNRARQLRAELKEWEHSFAAEHGRKPSREEVKKDPHISAKYKEYNKLRTSSLSAASRLTASSTETKPEHTPSTTKGVHDPFASAKSDKSAANTRKKAADIFKTPTKPRITSADQQEIYDSPLSLRRTRLFGNRPRDSVGPTPQKTGKVLGLFESFVDIEATPKKARDRVSASPVSTRKAGNANGEGVNGGANGGGEFATPRKRKAEEISVGSAKKCEEEFTTPSFLRRDSSRFQPLVESPPVPLPMRPVRGLSSMVAELRKMEGEAIEEEFADDEEAMKEMEVLDGEPSLPPLKKQRDEEVEVGIGDLPPGAFAEEAIVDESEGEDKDKPKWKKKGLKRQTKRTIMRPITTKPQEVPQEEDAPPNPADAELPSAGYDDDEDLSNIESGDEHTGKKAMVDKGKAVVKKVVRKVKATANANFRRLNIRGQGAKARGGGKFRRRR
ncbi:DNA replication/checkpoint protein [Tuber borchii]|uniref:DNA replication regulator SLD2 n=1 Tax=Tuber borchii TaxID=42251 RepID=A0A2T7A844_TUBBO|nr:DNA replication/checkpoint protein [Tuber borchii]